MSSLRGTPTPSSSRAGRPLTAEIIQEYQQLFESARLDRPVSPTLPPPPASTGSDTRPSPSSSESSGKRKRDDTSSNESPVPPGKRLHTFSYQVPKRTRRGPNTKARDSVKLHIDRAIVFKRRADKVHSTGISPEGPYLYGLSLLNFAFAYRLARDHPWGTVTGITDSTIERFTKLAGKESNPKLDAWLSYLQLFKNALDIQIEKEQLLKFRGEIDMFLKNAPSQQPHEASQGHGLAPNPTGAGPTSTSLMPGAPRQTTLPPEPTPVYSMSLEDAKNLHTLLTRARNGPHTGDSRRRVLRHLNPATLREHFPRTFMRAFGEDGLGHTPIPRDGHSPTNGLGFTGPLEYWEEHEIWDLEENEKEGGDFPYPSHPEDIFWVVILGRSMLNELGLVENV